MERSPARSQFHRCCRLCGCGFKWLGNTTGASARIAFGDRRAIRLGTFRFSSLCCLPCVESDVGRVHPRPKTLAKRNVLAIDNSDLAGRSGARFRAPLTMIAETSPLHSQQSLRMDNSCRVSRSTSTTVISKGECG
jgi:hypothetical protein